MRKTIALTRRTFVGQVLSLLFNMLSRLVITFLPRSKHLFPSPADLPNPGIEPRSLTFQADSLPAEPQGKPKNSEVGSLSLLQQIFLTQELKWGLLHCRWILYCLSHQRSTRKLEWVALSFSRGFSQPRNWTGVFCTVGRFFTSWATWKPVSNSMLAG